MSVATLTQPITRLSREGFVLDNSWAQGLSCLDIAIAVRWYGAVVEGPWLVTPRNAEKAERATRAAKRHVRDHLSA